MGLIPRFQPFFYDSLKMENIKLRGLKMCELGNQIYDMPNGRRTTAKRYFKSQGVKHVSMDFNGKDGALPIDLSKPIKNTKMIGLFDLITNFGTTEHVENNQWQCWKNIHELCRPGGYFIHMLPIFYYWADKQNKWFYYPRFFEEMALIQEYKIIKKDIIGWGANRNQDLLCYFIKKEEDDEFMGPPLFKNLPIRKVRTPIEIEAL